MYLVTANKKNISNNIKEVLIAAEFFLSYFFIFQTKIKSLITYLK